MKSRIPISLFAVLLVLGVESVVQGQTVPRVPPKVVAIQAQIAKQRSILETLEVRIVAIEKKSEKLQSEKKELVGAQTKIGVSKSSFAEIMKSLQSQKIQLAIDIAGLEAKQEAILANQKKSRVRDKHEVVVPLEKLLSILENEQQEIEKLHKAGAISQAELRKAQRAVLEAKIRLAQAKSNSARSESGQALLDTALELAEKKARLSKTESMLKAVVPAIDIMAKIDNLEHELTDLKGARKNLANKVELRKADLDRLLDELEKAKKDK